MARKQRKRVSSYLVIHYGRGKRKRVVRGTIELDIDSDRLPDIITFYRRTGRGKNSVKGVKAGGYVANVVLSSVKKLKKKKKK